jgi:hypothetical protein
VATAQSKLQIIIDVITGQGKVKVEGLDKQLKELGKTYAKVGIATAALGVAAKKAFDFGKEGASVSQLEDSFFGLMDIIGASPDIFRKLDKAAGGTITKMQLMSSAQMLLAGTSGDVSKAFIEAMPKLIEYARAASKLNPALGSSTYLLESLSTGIKRQQKLIIDNLGIVFSAEEAYTAYAESIGKAKSQLTGTDKTLAFLNATLEKGDVLLQQAGGSADSQTDSFTRLEVAISDLVDVLQMKAAPALADVAEGITGFIKDSVDFQDSVDAVKDAFKEGNITYLEHIVLLQQLRWRHIDDAEAMMVLTNAAFTGEQAFEKYSEMTRRANLELEAMEEAQKEATEAVDDGKDIAGEAAAQYGRYSQEQYEAAQSANELEEATWGVNEAMKSYSKQLLFNELSQNMTAEAALYLGQRMGLVDENTIKLLETIPELTKTYDLNEDGVIDLNEAMLGAAQAAIELDSTLSKFDGKVYRSKVITEFINVGGNVVRREQGRIEGGTGESEFQHGGSFLVPPGFNENFNLGRASSGERVTVQPRQSNTYNQTWNVYTNGGSAPYERDYNMRRALAN